MLIFNLAATTLAGALFVTPVIWRWRVFSKQVRKNSNEAIAAATDVYGTTESGLLDLIKTYPESPLPVIRWAESMIAEKRWDEALRRGKILSERFPNDVAGLICQSKALRSLGKFDLAETTLKKAMKSFPQNMFPLLEYVEFARHQRDWHAVIERCEVLCRKFPLLKEGYLWQAQALTEVERYIEAEAVLVSGHQAVELRWQKAMLMLYAELADKQEKWSEAVRRWALFRSHFDTDPVSYWKGARALRLFGQNSEGDRLISDGVMLFPKNDDVMAELKLTTDEARAL